MTAPLYVRLARLAGLREEWAALGRGSWTSRHAEDSGAGLLVFERERDGERVLVAVNTSSGARAAQVQTGFAGGAELRDLLDPAAGVGADGSGRVALAVPGYGTRLLVEAARWIEPRPIVTGFTPGHGKRARASAAVALVFSQGMDRASVEEAFSVTPAAPGSFAWAGDTLRFAPSGGWAPNTRYAVQVEASAASAGGRAMRGAFESWFETAAATPPGYLSGALTEAKDHWGAGGEVVSPVRVSGDVVVPRGITLRIEPRTEVLFSGAGDDQIGGDDPERIEIIIEGRIEVGTGGGAAGSSEAAGAGGDAARAAGGARRAAAIPAPVRFRGEGASFFGRGLWGGIRLADGSEPGSRIEGAQVWNATVGVRAEAPFDAISANAIFMPASEGLSFGGAAAGAVEDNFVFDAGGDGVLVEDGTLEFARNTVLFAEESGIECRGGTVSVRCGRLSFCSGSALHASGGAAVRFGPGVQVIPAGGDYLNRFA